MNKVYIYFGTPPRGRREYNAKRHQSRVLWRINLRMLAYCKEFANGQASRLLLARFHVPHLARWQEKRWMGFRRGVVDWSGLLAWRFPLPDLPQVRIPNEKGNFATRDSSQSTRVSEEHNVSMYSNLRYSTSRLQMEWMSEHANRGVWERLQPNLKSLHPTNSGRVTSPSARSGDTGSVVSHN